MKQAFLKRIWLWLVPFWAAGWLAACSGDAAVAPQVNVLFADSFAPGEMGEWQLEGDALGQTAVLDEQLVIEINQPNTLQFTTLTAPTFSDFVLEVDVRQLRGDLQSSFGVLFRMQGPDQFYRFEITGGGQYMLERRNPDGGWTRFVDDWTEAPAINPGLNVVNRLKVTANGRNIAVYVNDIILQQISDNAYSSGNIALDAGAFAQAGLQVAFDNLVVSEP